MQRKHVRQLVIAGVLAILPTGLAAQNAIHQSEHHSFRVTTVVEGLENPWSLAFLPNGDMLVTERPGRLRVIRDGNLLPRPVDGLPTIRTGGQGGLLDVVPHPDFASNRLIYFSYAKPNDDGSEGSTAVARGRFENDRLTDVEEIFEAEVWSTGRGHHGSRLVFDGNGYLFISLGDRQVDPSEDQGNHPAQDLSNHFGTIVRLNEDGSVPDDNPFASQRSALPEIWIYGHRNVQGLALHPDTGELWATEHGPQGGDELNLIQPGVNYGWPVIGYGVNYGPGLPLHRIIAHEDMANPVLHWTPSIAPSGLMIYSGRQFPAWRGNIFAGGMSAVHRELSRITVVDGLARGRESLLDGDYRIRDVREGPDGYIYLVTDDREGGLTPILRLEPASD